MNFNNRRLAKRTSHPFRYFPTFPTGASLRAFFYWRIGMDNYDAIVDDKASKEAEKLKIWQRPKDGGQEVFWDWYLHKECYQIPRPKNV